MPLSAVTLDDKYLLEHGRVYLTGTQALVRLPMMQRQRDLAAGLPRHATTSRLNSPSRVVWPGSTFNSCLTVSRMLKEPFTWQAVPRQTRKWYLPGAWNRNWL